jgi:hypothetical protein
MFGGKSSAFSDKDGGWLEGGGKGKKGKEKEDGEGYIAV